MLSEYCTFYWAYIYTSSGILTSVAVADSEGGIYQNYAKSCTLCLVFEILHGDRCGCKVFNLLAMVSEHLLSIAITIQNFKNWSQNARSLKLPTR